MDALQNAPLAVVTGGLGRVGTVLRPRLRQQFRLRLLDRVVAEETQPDSIEPGVEVCRIDVGDPDAVTEAFAGADAVVHLAGLADPKLGWEDLYAGNVRPLRAIFDAAAANAVPKVVLASSLHAAGLYNRPEYWPVSPRLDPAPCCPYGVSKVILEALGRSHAERTGASVTCLRLGLTGWPLTERRYLGMWLSPDDAGRLFDAALRTKEAFGVHFGVSANTRNHWDTTSAQSELGYHPQNDSELHAATAGPPTGPVCRIFDDPETSENEETR